MKKRRGLIYSFILTGAIFVSFGFSCKVVAASAPNVEQTIGSSKERVEQVFNEGMTIEGPTEVKVGDKGTFDIQIDYEGIPFDGKYVFNYDESLIKVDAQGNWEALKAGEVDITFGYLPSKKMLEDILNHFGGEIPPQKEIAKIHKMLISEKAIQQPEPLQTSASTTKQYPVTTSKQLPRTGERKMSTFIYLGAFITVFALWLIARNKRVSK